MSSKRTPFCKRVTALAASCYIVSTAALSIERHPPLHTNLSFRSSDTRHIRPHPRVTVMHTNRQSTALKSEACENSASGIKQSITKRNGDLSVPAVLFASFLNLLGFTMASPIQPALGDHFSLPMGASFGSLSSAYPLGMMFGVFMWPTLSDVIGRKIVMTLTLFGSGMGLLLQSWAVSNHWTLEQFLATRVLTGCFAGNSPISKAYLADRGSEGNKRDLTKYLAWKDASSTMAFIVGPVLGGLLYRGGKNGLDNTGGLSFVIRFSAMCSLVASLSVATFMKSKDSNKETAARQSAGEDNHLDAKKSEELIACPLGTKLWTGVATVACVSALYHAADSTFFAFFPSLLQKKLQLDTGSIGLAFTSFAFISFAMSAFVSSRFIQRYGPVASCATGLGTIATALFTLSYVAFRSTGVGIGASAVIILAAAGFYYTGVPLYGPTVPTMLLQCVPPKRRGAVMGFDGTVNTIARVISPLIMGDIHKRRGAGWCFGVAGCYALTAASLAVLRRWTVLRKDFVTSRAKTS
ncbi:hypothetical protein ACHAXN_012974 [Cyclotella atomus]